MVEYRLGYFATSLCGHDKGRLYMIVEEVGDMVGLCDGIHRCLDHPKMKKKKHVQMIRSKETAELFEQLAGRPDADLFIRKAIKAREQQAGD